MPKVIKPPLLCPECNRVWEFEKRTTTVKGEKTNYFRTIFHESLPKLGLEIELCYKCKENTDETTRTR